MEVLVTEEKKKIFRARKTMKISDRQQLDSLHSTLLTAAPALPSPSPPPLMNGTHKEDGQKAGDKDQNVSDSNSPQAQSPTSAASLNSPAPFLSLNLSPSSVSSQSPATLEETTPPTSPGNTVSNDLKSMEEEDRGRSSSNESVTPASTESKEKDTEGALVEEPKQKPIILEDPSVELTKESTKGSASCSPTPPPVSDYTEPMDTDSDATKAADPEPSTAETQEKKPSSPNLTTSDFPSSSCSSSSNSASSSSADRKQKTKISVDEVKKESDKSDDKSKRNKSTAEEKMEVDLSNVEKKEEKVGESTKPPRPSSTPPSNRVKEEKSSTSGLKRTLSEGYEKDGLNVKKEGKKMKIEQDELEAQLEFKFTAKAGSHHKLEKIVKQLVEERMQVLELTMFDKTFKELKDRVDKLECATKHQAAINTLQAKIARLSKKFGEANQASENKRKQEALAAAATAAAAAAAAATAATKTASVTNSPQMQRPLRNSMEVKQTPTIVTASATSAVVASPALAATVAASVPTSTSAVVSQTPILQLITSSANAATTLATAITTQSSTGTLLLKTAPGSGMMATGQPLLIQLPLSMNGQAGTLVNFPVSSLSAASSLNKSKNTAPTATFILKHAPAATTTVSTSASGLATVPALQAAPAQMSPTQISIGRAVYTGGAGGISTPNAGVSVTTARTPVQSVSVVGAMSSASSPAASGPAATGSTAPGPPQGTSLTSKTDNQATGSTPSKVGAPAARPKGSVIDLTEDDDDVQVTGVKNPVVATSSPTPRPNTVVSVTNSTGARLSPQSIQSLSSNPQLTVHHRPPQDPQLKPRTVNNLTPARGASTIPSLPTAPVPPRLPPEAERTSPPQQPQLKLVPSQTGIVLSWCVAETDQSCAPVDSYHLYAFHQDNSSSNAAQQHWKKIGEVKALPLPMACTLTQFQSGSTYHFAVRAKDIYGRFGIFCEPQCTNVISPSSS